MEDGLCTRSDGGAMMQGKIRDEEKKLKRMKIEDTVEIVVEISNLSATGNGLSLLTLSVARVIPLQFRELLFFISLYMVGIGQGGHKPCVEALGADQFDEDSAEQRKAKNSFFNWWYFGLSGGASVGILIATYIQDNVDWAIGFGIPTIAMAFLDKAAIVDDLDASCCQNSWRFCTPTQVEETKQIMRLVPIWLCCLMLAVVSAQPPTFFINQCSTMIRKISSSFEVSPASVVVARSLTAVTLVPSALTMLQRIGIGMFLSVISMVVAAFVEMKRLGIVREYVPFDHPNATVPMSFWWLLPQLIYGISYVFWVVGLQEFFYDQIPDGMQSMGAAAYLSIFGIGSFLSSVIISLIQAIRPEWLTNDLNSSHLDYFYWLLAGLSVLWLGFYICAAKRFVYRQTYYGLS
ncbi:protein NRT1/ PTR FAMILY 5.10-like [Magnolia sinica]|uniref:protein NRT1/ PTR FAMILY 5.10-like n=1 Tax=Magnolia sinica TaxID=86752 RepID=UPI00265B6C4F|nr:protein NRT1/ PTR FAMILY 5.10-like [Magnolia sinica]